VSAASGGFCYPCRPVVALAVRIALVAAALAGCAGRLDYTAPAPGAVVTSRTVDRPLEAAWTALVAGLERRRFSLDVVDRAAGRVDLAYRGDPEPYVDCGTIVSSVRTLRGERRYEFPAARAAQVYEVMSGRDVYAVDRRLRLDGRMDVRLEAVGPATTRATARGRYVVSRTQYVRRGEHGLVESFSHTTVFDSRGMGELAGPGPVVTCRPTGRFEADVLDALGTEP